MKSLLEFLEMLQGTLPQLVMVYLQKKRNTLREYFSFLDKKILWFRDPVAVHGKHAIGRQGKGAGCQ